ncbi:hypothetical protein AB0L53_32380 [Nonomuraea sp. NPDC052129]|uniref:hypothetical protein n=1 Tax=Nonomuraea sp. NPDC052129 TaxID=3154651 RepID=UPI00344A4C63
MTYQRAQRREPTSRKARVLVGIVVALVVAALGVAAFYVWAGISLRSYQDNQQKLDMANMRQRADMIKERLHEHSQDGALTDTEINEAVLRYPWRASRGETEIQVTVRIQASTPVGPRCFTYSLALPLQGQSQVTQQETSSCDEASHHPEFGS